MTPRDWSTADRISDRIVDVINTERTAMLDTTGHTDPLQMFAGQLLALMAFFRTMRADIVWPDEILMVQRDVEMCLQILLALPPADDGERKPH